MSECPYKYATIDIETTGLNRYKDKITWVGIGLSKSITQKAEPKIHCINVQTEDGLNKFLKLYNKIKKYKLKTVFQNGKFDTLFLEEHYGIKTPISEDVMLMGTAYDLAEEHGLKKMAQKYLGVPDWDISTKSKKAGGEDIAPYLRCDVLYTWELFVYFLNSMTQEQMKIYNKLLYPAYIAYRDVERNGAYLDIKQLREVRAKYNGIEQQKLNELNKFYQINWNSSKQLSEVLFQKEHMPILKKSAKTNLPSADAEVLKKLAAKGYEIPKLLLEYKAANTLNKMFLNRWENDLGSDKRIHPSFNLTNVVTGRTSCQNPNFQQVPRTKDVRGLFHAPKGRLFFEADYSQLELRIAADYANETTMLKIYHENGDIHTQTAMLMTGGREPTKEERGKAKAVNFGFLYGMLAKKFVDYAYNSYGAKFTLPEAENFRALFFQKYSRLLSWHKEMEEMCELMGGVANKFGRFRKLPNIYSSNRFERLSAVRRAINTPVQGTGSDLLISSMAELNKKFAKEGLKIVGTVHDSILGEFYEEDKEWMVAEIRKVMLHPHILDVFGVELKVPLDVDIGVGPWGTH